MQALKRNHGLDNVRTLMVLCILLLHGVCAYASTIPWWHAQDEKSQGADLLIFLLDGFALPVLFFVSGTFAGPSFDRKTPSSFILSKCLRLGVPLVVLSAFYLPPMVYMGYLRRVAAPLPFGEYWLRWMGSLADWGFTLFTSMESAAPYADTFSPHHLWFVSLLLVFFTAYAGMRIVRPAVADSGRASGWQFLLAGGGMALGFALVNGVVQDWAWARLGPFLLFQPTRLPVYWAAFVLGIYARPRMELSRPMSGPVWGWLLLFIVAQGVLLMAIGAWMQEPGAATWGQALAHGALRAAVTLSAICLFVNAGCGYAAKASAWRASLAASSYDVYLLHMPLTVFIQVGMVGVFLPLGVKMALAFLLPLAGTWWLSRFMAGRRMWLCPALLGVYWAGFCLVC